MPNCAPTDDRPAAGGTGFVADIFVHVVGRRAHRSCRAITCGPFRARLAHVTLDVSSCCALGSLRPVVCVATRACLTYVTVDVPGCWAGLTSVVNHIFRSRAHRSCCAVTGGPFRARLTHVTLDVSTCCALRSLRPVACVATRACLAYITVDVPGRRAGLTSVANHKFGLWARWRGVILARESGRTVLAHGAIDIAWCCARFAFITIDISRPRTRCSLRPVACVAARTCLTYITVDVPGRRAGLTSIVDHIFWSRANRSFCAVAGGAARTREAALANDVIRRKADYCASKERCVIYKYKGCVSACMCVSVCLHVCAHTLV